MLTNAARAFWVAAPGRGEIRDEIVPDPLPDDVVVRARFSGISRGTEAIVFGGRVPVSEYGRMRAPFQTGDFPAPIKYGYASVGEIERGALSGRPVFVLYPHQTRYVVPSQAVYVVPATVPPARAVLAANLETAINGLWDARPQIGDHIVVIGAGTVGCLTAWLAAKTAGCEVELVDANPARATVAERLGVGFASVETSGRRPDSADLAIHASGSPEGLALALRVAAFEATVLDMSWYGSTLVPLRLGEGFHSKRLTLKSSQVGVVAAPARARWNARRRMELALDLLADPTLDALITGESTFEELPETMARLATTPGDTICHRIRYD